MATSLELSASDCEDKILRSIACGAPVSVERALLVVSGLKSDEEIQSYRHKVDHIFQRFLAKCEGKNLFHRQKPPPYLHRDIGKLLFEYLWNSKPRRFGEHFLLTQVIDAQLDPDIDQCVGTCVGLTSLYSVLGLRAGLNLTLVMNSEHLLNRLRVGDETIDIDHTDPQGFGCGNCHDFTELPVWMLVASVLNSRGLCNERNGKFAAAKMDYEKAIVINPKYANAYNNRGNMKLQDEDIEGAIADYTEAIRLNPEFFEAYCNRGMARQKLGCYDEARMDYSASISLNEKYSDAHKCLRTLENLTS